LERGACRGTTLEIAILIFLIVLNGVFAMSELAIVSAKKPRLKASADRGNKGAKAALTGCGNSLPMSRER
jgi:CBS domain containing-hemolysin-like protein